MRKKVRDQNTGLKALHSTDLGRLIGSKSFGITEGPKKLITRKRGNAELRDVANRSHLPLER